MFTRFKDKVQKNNFMTLTHDNVKGLNKVLSKSGIDFKELYYVNHNKYFTCFEIFEFPKTSRINQLDSIINQNNVYVAIDVEPIDLLKFEKEFDKIIDKKTDDFKSIQSESTARNIQNEYQELNTFYRQEKDYKEGVVSGTVRLFVFDKSLEDLEKRSNDLQVVLKRSGFSGAFIQTNNLEEDYNSLTSFNNPVKQYFLNSTIAEWLGRSNINIIDDEKTLLLGYTRNGVFAPNQFNFKYHSYNTVIMSGMGGGKSALSKKNTQNKLLKGNHTVGILDVQGEYDLYAKTLGIQSVSFSEDKHINFLQIFFTDNNDNSSIINVSDISTKIASVLATFEHYTGIKDTNTINLFSVILTALYEDKYLGKDINALENKHWFILSDVIDYIKSDNFEKLSITNLEKINIDEERKALLIGLTKMTTQDSFLFNNQTNIVLDLTKSIRFDISFLKNQDDKTLSAYSTMLLDYLGYGVYLNQQRNERMAKENGTNMSMAKEPYHTHELLLDEFIRYSKDKGFLIKCNDLIRYQRKCFSGMTIIIHSTSDFDTNNSENSDLLKTLFNLCTHKYIGKVEHDDLHKLQYYIPNLNDNDIHNILGFGKGNTGARSFISIDDMNRKTIFNSIITPREREFYKGGN